MPTCCGVVILNHALGNPFYVCTECHQEVTPMPPTTPDSLKAAAPSVAAPRPSPYTFSASVHPGTPASISVELVEQLELLDPWTTGDLSFDNNKDDDNV